ncbi:hypothetical protein SAMN02910317_03044 [Ruminococcaceae bacterium FB2012]|nr:hypothetical protein SAMN02910317_03044 [Ruminococcaceae bacterium FB2012]
MFTAWVICCGTVITAQLGFMVYVHFFGNPLQYELFNQNKANETYLDGNLKITKTDKEYRIRVNKNYVQKLGDDDDGIYKFPIDLTVYTGNDYFNDDTGGRMYSNYRIEVNAAFYPTLDGGVSTVNVPSIAEDFLIYTNARLEPNVIR